MFLPIFHLLVKICGWFCVIPALHKSLKRQILSNNYLGGCKAFFEGSTIATLFTKTRHRTTCNLASKWKNMKFICSFSSRPEFLYWYSKSVLFCLLYLTIHLWPPASLLSCLLTVQTSIARIAWEVALYATSTPAFSPITPWTSLQQSKIREFL